MLKRLQPFLREGSVIIILIVIGAIFSFLSEDFLAFSNLSNIVVQSSFLLTVSIGMTYILLNEGLDLSVGSVMALSGALSAGFIVRSGWGTAPAILATLGIGGLIGLINGSMVVFGGIPAFIATLAMLGIARGLTLVYTEGRPIAGLPESYRFLGSGSFMGIPMPAIIVLGLVIVGVVVLRRTRFGLYVRAIGSNEEISRLAGISITPYRLAVYILSGFLAALAGILLAARLWSAQPTAAVGFELDAIAAPVLGGTSLFGGSGSVIGTVAGALIMGTLSNGLTLMGVPSYNQQVIRGLVFIAAVIIDVYSKQRGD